MKAPNPKFQISNKFKIPMIKIPNRFRILNLEFVCYLVLGAWNL